MCKELLSKLQSMKKRKHLLAFAIIYVIFIWVISSQFLVMVHNSPLNRYGDFSDLDNNSGPNATAELQNFPNASDAKFGLTFGNPDKRIFTQISKLPRGKFIVAFLRPYILAIAPLYVVLMIVIILITNYITDRPALQFSIKLIGGIISFSAIILAVFHSDPKIQFITQANESVPVVSARDEISSMFYFAIISQGAIIGSLAAVWTRPVIPDKSDDTEVIRLHIENWRKYGSWIATLFGGVFLTIALVFITDLSSVGQYFLRHAIVLFGGGLILHLVFITYKISKLEERFCSIKERQRNRLPKRWRYK